MGRVNLKPMMMVVQDGGEEADNLKGEEEGVPKFRGKGNAQRRKASCFCVKKWEEGPQLYHLFLIVTILKCQGFSSTQFYSEYLYIYTYTYTYFYLNINRKIYIYTFTYSN